jgi:DNA-binding NarL/FixJ family response regulator
LRGRRELRRARTVLHEAVRIAETAGATLIAEPAQAELAGAGGRRRGSRPGGSLTAQESRVAGLAVTGATVQEIATAMYLSPRTVETHLARVYRKLGVASKAELRRRKSELSIQPADLDGTSQR